MDVVIGVTALLELSCAGVGKTAVVASLSAWLALLAVLVARMLQEPVPELAVGLAVLKVGKMSVFPHPQYPHLPNLASHPFHSSTPLRPAYHLDIPPSHLAPPGAVCGALPNRHQPRPHNRA